MGILSIIIGSPILSILYIQLFTYHFGPSHQLGSSFELFSCVSSCILDFVLFLICFLIFLWGKNGYQQMTSLYNVYEANFHQDFA